MKEFILLCGVKLYSNDCIFGIPAAEAAPLTEDVMMKVAHRATGFDSGTSEHQIIFRRWRLGFLIFYGAITSLLGGFVLVADRQGTLVSAAAPLNPAMASTNTMRRANDGRARE